MQHPTRLELETPDGHRSLVLDVDSSIRLTELLRRHGLALNVRCGQRGRCDGCLVDLLAGRLVDEQSGQLIEPSDAPLRLRACQYGVAVGQSASLRVLPRSLLAHEPQIVTSFRLLVPRAEAPLVPLAAARLEPALGVAVDLGTTTVVLLVVDLKTGEVVGEASRLNAQVEYGDNVLTRINECQLDPHKIERLKQAVVQQTIAPLLRQALHRAGASADQLAGMVVAGNTTMLHLLLGVDPSAMGHVPFTPAFLDHRVVEASDLGGLADLESSDSRAVKPPIHLLPSAAAYLGADVVAGLLATGLIYADETCMLVDVGTNGEIVLMHHGRLYGCATAAGPAFEGSGLHCGSRAGTGAIDHVQLDAVTGSVDVSVIGGRHPIGLCGTAYVDVIAQLRNAGLIGATGRFLPVATDPWPIRDLSQGRALVVASDRHQQPLFVTEGDIACLLQAKAAIAAGVLCLLDRVGLQTPDLDRIYLAGGFGLHLDVQHAITIGLLPGIDRAKIELVGNSSLAGAYLSLLDRGAVDELVRIASSIEVIELNLEPKFESHFIDQLMLP